jgi:hypothetical protein
MMHFSVLQYVQKLAEAGNMDLKGIALICSVPPSGNAGIVSRYFRAKPWTAIDITLVTSPPLCITSS